MTPPTDGARPAAAGDRFHKQLRVFLEVQARVGPPVGAHWPSRVKAALQDRRFGGQDRKVYRSLLYSAARLWPWLEGAARDLAWAEVVAALSDLPQARREGVEPAPQALSDWPRWVAERLGAGARGLSWRGLLPAWMWDEVPDAAGSDGEGAWALLRRKPLWIRRQRVGWEALGAALDAAQVRWRRLDPPDDAAPDAAEVEGDPDLTRTEAWRAGWLEVQDLGSQRLLGLSPLEMGGTWLDACAGAGGKALLLAARLGPAGRVVAEDVRQGALDVLLERAERAGVRGQLAARAVSGGGASQGAGPRFDGVLVDAPCTGTGTWGRHPHMRATTTPEAVAEAAARQAAILGDAAARVRPGGLVLYATCSVLASENAGVVQGFLARHPAFEVVPLRGGPSDLAGPEGLTLWPGRQDGFFVSALRLRG